MTDRRARVRYVPIGELAPLPYDEPECASCRELRAKVKDLEMHAAGIAKAYLKLQRQTAAARTILAARLGRPGLDRYEVAQAFDLLATCEALREEHHADATAED